MKIPIDKIVPAKREVRRSVEFDVTKCPPILVHKMKNGKYKIIDGQFRLLAALKAGATEMEVVVHEK